MRRHRVALRWTPLAPQPSAMSKRSLTTIRVCVPAVTSTAWMTKSPRARSLRSPSRIWTRSTPALAADTMRSSNRVVSCASVPPRRSAIGHEAQDWPIRVVQEPVVKVAGSTETGEAPAFRHAQGVPSRSRDAWQGAARERVGHV